MKGGGGEKRRNEEPNRRKATSCCFHQINDVNLLFLRPLLVTATMDTTTSDHDPYFSQLAQHWRTLQMSFASFCQQLEEVPHSFQLHLIDGMYNDQLNKVKGTLSSSLEVGYHTAVETARARNLQAYLLFRLGQYSKALEQIDLVLSLEGETQNLVSLANKAVILYQMGRRSEAQKIADRLMTLNAKLPEWSELVTKARAELAFSYTRFGPRFYPLAQSLFREVIPLAREPEVWLWTFGLALTRRRLLPLKIKDVNDEEKFRSVLDLYLEITRSCDNLKAKAYAEMALLLHMPVSVHFKELLQKISNLSVEEACDLALQHDSQDNSVLWKCGKIYRYLRKTDLSCELLKKAVKMRATSKGYHHLGLTFKALATREKYKDSEQCDSRKDVTAQDCTGRTNPDTFEKFQISQQWFRTVSSETQSDHGQMQPGKQMSDAKDDFSAQKKEGHSSEERLLPSIPSSQKSYQAADESTKEAYKIWTMVKSPLNRVTSFIKGDAYIEDTVTSLSRAVEISEWENAAAIYDLALVYRSMGDLEQAAYCLERSLSKPHSCLRVLNKINVFEQLGFIFADMAKDSVCQAKSANLMEKSQSMLLMALKTAVENYSKIPIDENHIGGLWQSFPALMEHVDTTNKSSAGKLRDKARLFHLIRKNKTSLAILQDIEKMDPLKGNDPEHLKLCIENYVEMHRFEEALVFVDLLQFTSQHDRAMELFQDRQFLDKIYLQAAQQSLQRGSANFRLHFKAAFDLFDSRGSNCTASEGDSSETGEERDPVSWDVHILHEETEEGTDIAETLVSLLAELCGLRATRLDEDVMGGFHLEGVFDVMGRSKVVVVLVVGGQKLSEELRYFISVAAQRPTSLAVLVGGAHVPKVMKVHRSMTLPDELVRLTKPLDPRKLCGRETTAVCDLFAFLVNLQPAAPQEGARMITE